MMFPAAESLGDLIYRKKSTAQNLISVLDKDFEDVRTGYFGKAAVLALLYRHSLTHHDELRTITSGARKIGWLVSGAEDANHLSLHHSGEDLMIEFQPRSFYADIIAVCENAERVDFGGEVMRQYNGWMNLDLDAAKSTYTIKVAIAEIDAFKRLP